MLQAPTHIHFEPSVMHVDQGNFLDEAGKILVSTTKVIDKLGWPRYYFLKGSNCPAHVWYKEEKRCPYFFIIVKRMAYNPKQTHVIFRVQNYDFSAKHNIPATAMWCRNKSGNKTSLQAFTNGQGFGPYRWRGWYDLQSVCPLEIALDPAGIRRTTRKSNHQLLEAHPTCERDFRLIDWTRSQRGASRTWWWY